MNNSQEEQLSKLLTPKLHKRTIKLGLAYLLAHRQRVDPTRDVLMAISGMNLDDGSFNNSHKALCDIGVIHHES